MTSTAVHALVERVKSIDASSIDAELERTLLEACERDGGALASSLSASDAAAQATAIKAEGVALFTARRDWHAFVVFRLAGVVNARDELHPSNESAALARLGRFDEAVAAARRCVALAPNWAKAYSRLGVALFGLRQYDDALVALERGLELDGDNTVLRTTAADTRRRIEAANFNEKAEEFMSRGKPAQAVDFLNRTIERDDTDALYYVNRARAHLALHDAAAALHDAQRAIELRPSWAKGYNKYADVLFYQRKWDDAASVYARSLALEPSEKIQKCLHDCVAEKTREHTAEQFRREQAERAKNGDTGGGGGGGSSSSSSSNNSSSNNNNDNSDTSPRRQHAPPPAAAAKEEPKKKKWGFF